MTTPARGLDKHKLLTLVILPALVVLVLIINPIWNIPHQDTIIFVIVGVWAFVGALRGFGSKPHVRTEDVDGYMYSDSVHPDSGLPNLEMTIVRDPTELLEKQHLTFKVGRPPQNG